MYSFKGGSSDGEQPQADLIYVKGALHGTTTYGGAYGDGTAFKVTADGTETVLHNFNGGADGKEPQTGLTEVNGTLFGTTPFGGAYNFGMVYSLTGF